MISHRQIFIVFILLNFFLIRSVSYAQKTVFIDRESIISLANSKSFESYTYKYEFLMSELDYRDVRNSSLPSLIFNSSPMDYSKSISEQWNSDDLQFTPYEVRRMSNSGNITLQQPIGLTGGSLNVISSFRRNKTFHKDFSTSNYTTTPISISYNQTLMGINEIKWNNRLAKLNYKEANQRKVHNSEQVALESIKLYYDLLIAQSRLELSKVTKQYADSLYWMAQRRKNISSITDQEYLQSEIQKTAAQILLDQETQAEINIIRRIRNHLNLPENTEIQCIPDFSVPKVFISLDVAIIKTYENNPIFINQKRKIKESELALKKAKMDPYKIGINANLGLNQNSRNFESAYQHLTERQGIGLNLSVPIYNGGKRSRQVQRAQLIKEYSEKEALENERNLMTDLTQKVNEFNILNRQLQAFAKTDSLSNYIYHVTKESFKLGNTTVKEVIEAQENQLSARITYLQQIQDYWMLYYVIRSICLYDFERETNL